MADRQADRVYLNVDCRGPRAEIDAPLARPGVIAACTAADVHWRVVGAEPGRDLDAADLSIWQKSIV